LTICLAIPYVAKNQFQKQNLRNFGSFSNFLGMKLKPAKVLRTRPLNWPSEKELKRMDRILTKAKANRGLKPGASLLDRFKYKICEQFVIYLNDGKITQRQLAKKLGVSESRICEIVHYHFDKVTLDRLITYLTVIRPELKISITSP
jgi:predicted XRE-type DNA-binding protein